jgi:hypothetical protein
VTALFFTFQTSFPYKMVHGYGRASGSNNIPLGKRKGSEERGGFSDTPPVVSHGMHLAQIMDIDLTFDR